MDLGGVCGSPPPSDSLPEGDVLLPASLSKSDQPALAARLRWWGDVDLQGLPPQQHHYLVREAQIQLISLSPSPLPLPHLFQMETFLWGVPAEWLKPRSLLGVHSIQGRGTQPRPSTVGEQTDHSCPSQDLGLPPATLSPPCSGARAARKPVGHVKRPTGSYLHGGRESSPALLQQEGRDQASFTHCS